MKNMRKLFAMVLAVMMVMSLATTVSAASITITPPDTNKGTETGITYTAYKIFDATISGTNVAYTIDSSSPYYNAVSSSGYFTLTQVGTSTTYTVVAKDTYTEEVANTFAETLKAVTGATSAGTLTKQNDGNYKLDNLDNGYYLVTSSVGSDLILDTIGDITVSTKNEYPGLDKKVEGGDSTTADKGEVITFTIDVTIPEDAVGEIVVHDKMTGLEYVGMTAVEGITVADGANDCCTKEFTLSSDYVAANKGETVTITYTAKVTADVANNEAWLVDDSYTTKPDHVDVYSTDIVINKVIAGTETPLEGAKFVLKNAEGKFYNVDANGNVTWAANENDATVVITDAAGKAEFTDIADGTYNLVETEAPAGYNKLTEPVEVKVEATLDNDGAVIDIVSKVENNSGTELPSTGGMGTQLFYVFGGIMVLAAVVLLVTKRRMNIAE